MCVCRIILTGGSKQVTKKLSFRGPQLESCYCPIERAYDDIIVTHKNSLRYKLRTHLCHI